MNTLTLLLLLATPQAAQQSKVRIAPEDEPGIPFVLKAKVVDGSSQPLPGVKVYIYQTDAKGLYRLPGGIGFRLKATAWTDGQGIVEFITIRPGPYPGAKSGEHFHMELSGGGLPDSFARIDFYDDRPRNKVVVATGKKSGSASHYAGPDWKPDPTTKGQRLEVELRMKSVSSGARR